MEARLASLDGLRGVAILAVVLFHGGIFGWGWIGVDLFFAISGYLITGIVLNTKATGLPWRVTLVPFYVRRALRILPLTWLAVFMVAFATGEWEGAGWYASYLVNWHPHPPEPRALIHFWSLAVELQFYLIWPAVVLFCSREALLRVLVGTFVIATLCRAGLIYWQPDFATAPFLGCATLLRADALAAGALISIIEDKEHFLTSDGFLFRLLFSLGVVGTVVSLSLMGLERFHDPAYILQPLFLALACASALLWVLHTPPQWLSWRWLTWLGTISFGIYVIHGCMVAWLLRNDVPPLQRTAILLFSIPAAALSWKYFESPFLSLKRHCPMPTIRTRKHSNRMASFEDNEACRRMEV